MEDDGIKNNLTTFTRRIKIIRPNHNCSKKCMNHLDKFNFKMFWFGFGYAISASIDLAGFEDAC